MGANAAQRRADQQNKANQASAEANRYSPWTNKSYGYNHNYAPSALEGGFGGAVQGAAIGQSVDGWLKGMSANPTANLNTEQAANYNALQGATSAPDANQFGTGATWSDSWSMEKPNLFGSRPIPPRSNPWSA